VPYDLHLDPRSSHQRIAAIARRSGREPILDIGASSGQLGRLLDGSGLTIDGLEPDPATANDALPYYRSFQVARIEDAELPQGVYRLIVCADVLEHTVDPVASLQRVLSAATPDARVVVSLPNIGHLAARAVIAAGSFPEHDRGIFDRTHLHFYTRRTAIRLLARAGLRPLTITGTPVPLEQIWPRWLPGALREGLMRAQGLMVRLRPTLFAFQWVIVAERA
jgi:SAM-dependent methyltransferase